MSVQNMESYIGKVTSRGQVTLPAELRKAEGITGEDYVVMRKEGKNIVISKLEARLRRMDEITDLMEAEAKRKGITQEDILEEVKKVRRERYLVQSKH